MGKATADTRKPAIPAVNHWLLTEPTRYWIARFHDNNRWQALTVKNAKVSWRLCQTLGYLAVEDEKGLMTPDEFFARQPKSMELFEAVRREVEVLGETGMRVTKSQIAFRRRRGFAWVWMPERHLKRQAAPLVLSLSLAHRDTSPRWKQIVEPYPGRFMHHLELYDAGQIDKQVIDWLRQAWEFAA